MQLVLEDKQSEKTGHSRCSEQREWLDAFRRTSARQRDRWRRAESWWSWGRLAAFLAAIAGWYPLTAAPALAAAVSALGVVTFAIAIIRHGRCRHARDAADRLLKIIDETSQRCGGQVALIRSHERPHGMPDGLDELPAILDAGSTWPLSEQERDDLDFYSPPVGVFGLLNRTSTAIGARRLADWLENPCLSPEHILARQAAVRWLQEHAAERSRLMAAAAGLRREDRSIYALIRAAQRAQPLSVSGNGASLRIWSLGSLALATYIAFQLATGNFVWLWALFGLCGVNGLLFQRIRGELAACLHLWRDVAQAVTGCLNVARCALADLPDETDLKLLRRSFEQLARPAALPALGRRVGWSEGGGFIKEFFNVIFFYELHIAAAILKRAVPIRDELQSGMSALADLEALLSLACLAWEQPVGCYPVPQENTALNIRAGLHPLIAPDRAVPNDVQLDDKLHIWIITGSNMAGKSTLIRMIGVNVLFAQIGTIATAEAMTFSPVRLLTDLRARDDLSQDASYFLTEVRQLRRMILPPEGSTPVLGLIDEPLRGTNSQEQVAASLAVVRHLLDSRDMFLIATHDHKLTELADGRAAANRHFREDLNADGLVFDYLLRPGPATTRNALRILEREGYPSELVARARQWIEAEDDRQA